MCGLVSPVGVGAIPVSVGFAQLFPTDMSISLCDNSAMGLLAFDLAFR